MTALAELTISNARRFAHGHSLETDGPNDGPFIREWLGERGIAHPAPWCAAFACAQIHEAARALQMTLKLRYSAGALRLLALNPELVIDTPEPGCLVVFDHGGGLGHVGIVTEVATLPVSYDMISGNTSADGHSRNGDRVVERVVILPNPLLAGYLRVA